MLDCLRVLRKVKEMIRSRDLLLVLVNFVNTMGWHTIRHHLFYRFPSFLSPSGNLNPSIFTVPPLIYLVRAFYSHLFTIDFSWAMNPTTTKKEPPKKGDSSYPITIIVTSEYFQSCFVARPHVLRAYRRFYEP
jgi:hypothetical protein